MKYATPAQRKLLDKMIEIERSKGYPLTKMDYFDQGVRPKTLNTLIKLGKVVEITPGDQNTRVLAGPYTYVHRAADTVGPFDVVVEFRTRKEIGLEFEIDVKVNSVVIESHVYSEFCDVESRWQEIDERLFNDQLGQKPVQPDHKGLII